MIDVDEATREMLEKLSRDINSKIDSKIAEHGWADIGVLGDKNGPSFSYTIGLTGMGFPEIIVFALPGEIAHEIISATVEMWKKSGVSPEGVPIAELANLPVVFKNVTGKTEWHMFGTHRRFGDFRTFQMVLPDANGKFPWEPNYDPKMIISQSVLVDWCNIREKAQ